jgi:hypothetical protein
MAETTMVSMAMAKNNLDLLSIHQEVIRNKARAIRAQYVRLAIYPLNPTGRKKKSVYSRGCE